MSFEALFFDLDDTLYPSTSGIWQAVGDRMEKYMVEVLGFKLESVAAQRDELFTKYGTTFRGLRTLYKIDSHEFLEFVHDIPLESYIRRDDLLIETLRSIPGRKIIFTNANQSHAERVLSFLGLEDCFEQIIDILQISPFSKPFPEAFLKAVEIAGGVDPQKCVVIDDSSKNLITARELGFFTIQVGTDIRQDFADAVILSILDLPDVIPMSTQTIGRQVS